MPERITGLDIGGAHLKAAQVASDGRLLDCVQVPCALWQGLDRLEAALATVQASRAPIDATAITMTGELADLFPDRATGVQRLVEAVTRLLPAATHRIWAGRRGFVAPHEAAAHAAVIASMNWLASASIAARRTNHAVFIDFGSTTTDILLLSPGEVLAQGFTDHERLATGELVYTGLTRTPVMALAPRAPFAGRWVTVMNELFATTADVHRVLGSLPEAADQHPAADQGEKSWQGSARRLARMIGADLADGAPADWQALAAWFARCQMRQIEDALALQLSRGRLPPAAPIVGAGCGRMLLTGLGRPLRDFADLIDAPAGLQEWVAICAPAVAVALLACEEDDAAR